MSEWCPICGQEHESFTGGCPEPRWWQFYLEQENKRLEARIDELEKELDVEKAKNTAWEKVWKSSLPTVSTGERYVIYEHKKVEEI